MVAKKEFLDLLNSRLIVLILAWYVIVFVLLFYELVSTDQLMNVDNPVKELFIRYLYTLCYYGSLVAVVLGFSSMSSEISGKALNTLLAKPLYRDTIIRGKMIAAVGFIAIIFFVISLLYVLGILLFIGSPLVKLNAFLSVLPLAFMLYLLCMIFYYVVSMLALIVIREQSLALFMGFLFWILLFYFIPNEIFTGSIDYFFGERIGRFVGGMSHLTMLNQMFGYMDIQGVLVEKGFEVMKMALYCFIGIILVHIAFLRRDVS